MPSHFFEIQISNQATITKLKYPSSFPDLDGHQIWPRDFIMLLLTNFKLVHIYVNSEHIPDWCVIQTTSKKWYIIEAITNICWCDACPAVPTCDSIFIPRRLLVNMHCFHNKYYICDQIWENPPYAMCAWFTQFVFLVAQVQICRSPDFIISMSNNPSVSVAYRG